MSKHRDYLDALISTYLAGATSFEAFGTDYSTYYLEAIPDDGLTDEEFEWSGDIHERIEWTSEAPTREEQGYGWMTIEQFRRWLQDQRALRSG